MLLVLALIAVLCMGCGKAEETQPEPLTWSSVDEAFDWGDNRTLYSHQGVVLTISETGQLLYPCFKDVQVFEICTPHKGVDASGFELTFETSSNKSQLASVELVTTSIDNPGKEIRYAVTDPPFCLRVEEEWSVIKVTISMVNGDVFICSAHRSCG